VVALLDLAVPKMSEVSSRKSGDKRAVSTYRLYRDTMQRLVEIAEYREMTVAELCEPLLASFADAEYKSMLRAKLAAEEERQKQMTESQKKRGKPLS
jgi:predicted DNA-binding ribbon-helix-helix protein